MKISVLTPSYNSAKYIERAIQSVVRQDYENWEHIIVDGNSEDNTVEILKSYSHLKWISEPDQGQSDAMNKAFRMSSGDIIVYLNADDWFEKNVFTIVTSTMNKDTNVDILLGNVIINYASLKIEERKPSAYYNDIITYWRILFPANPVCYFYHRKVQERIGLFPVKNHYTMDYWFLLKVYQQFNISHLDQVFGTFYLDGSNKTSVSNTRKNLHLTVLRHLLYHDQKKFFFFVKEYFNRYTITGTVEWEILVRLFQKTVKR